MRLSIVCTGKVRASAVVSVEGMFEPVTTNFSSLTVSSLPAGADWPWPVAAQRESPASATMAERTALPLTAEDWIFMGFVC
jgi:hypothetical protein